MSVTLSLFAGAGAQFLDNNGAILSGGLIYTYTAGTTTPLATYTSNLGTVAQPNPIVLDSAGRIPGGELWLTTGYGYKFVVEDANGVLIGSYDNVPSSAQPPIVNDASSISYEQGNSTTAGSFIVGDTYLITSLGTTNFQLIGASANQLGIHFLATGPGTGTGTGQLSITVQSKLQEWVSVKDFGATGNGTTDDTAAIQAAINAFSSNATIYFPTGTYAINANGMQIASKNNVRLVGQEGATIKYLANQTHSWFSGTDHVAILFTSCTNSSIENLIVNPNYFTGIAIGLDSCTKCSIKGNTVSGVDAFGQVITINGSYNNLIDNYIYSSDGSATRGIIVGNLNVGQMENNCYVSGNTVTNNSATGIGLACHSSIITNNNASYNQGIGSGIVVAGGNSLACYQLTISNNICIGNTGHGIQSDVVYGSSLDLTADISVCNNVCANNSYSGIYMSYGNRWVVNANIFKQNTTYGIAADVYVTSSVISNNSCYANAIGIQVANSVANNYTRDLLVNGNYCNLNTNYGINVAAGGFTIYNIIVNNNICTVNNVGISVSESIAGLFTESLVNGNICQQNTSTNLNNNTTSVTVSNNIS